VLCALADVAECSCAGQGQAAADVALKREGALMIGPTPSNHNEHVPDMDVTPAGRKPPPICASTRQVSPPKVQSGLKVVVQVNEVGSSLEEISTANMRFVMKGERGHGSPFFERSPGSGTRVCHTIVHFLTANLAPGPSAQPALISLPCQWSEPHHTPGKTVRCMRPGTNC